jgi:hypothetical protein
VSYGITPAQPGGVSIIAEWIDEVFCQAPRMRLWTALDDRLRLALAQGWILSTQGQPDDDLAEELAADDSTDRSFPAMVDDLRARWRSVYSTLRNGMGLWDHVNLVGADLELVVVTAPECIGDYPEGGEIPAHSFITRLEADDWYIAALARRLPVPGWPPGEEVVPGLGI